MKVLGLIVEYNPFHNGHLYHIQKSRELTQADHVICVISGNFIQRGEPAVINKWARTRMALHGGADLVIELPVPFAMASAEFFAFGAVKLLDSTGITDMLCFGSEAGTLAPLKEIAALLQDEPQQFRELLKQTLDTGVSFPAARASAVAQYLSAHAPTREGIDSLFSLSNNILGIEYLKALHKLQSRIVPFTLPRIGNSYTDTALTGAISSATAIRRSIEHRSSKHKLETAAQALPPFSQQLMEEELAQGRGPVFSTCFENILLYRLRQMTTEELQLLPYVTEGLENRIYRATQSSGSLQQLLESLCTRRFTRTRIQRILMSLLTGTLQQDLEQFMRYGGPQYLRILGFNDAGAALLTHMKKHATLPLITRATQARQSCNPLVHRMMELEARSTDTYVLGYSDARWRKPGQEFTTPVIRY